MGWGAVIELWVLTGIIKEPHTYIACLSSLALSTKIRIDILINGAKWGGMRRGDWIVNINGHHEGTPHLYSMSWLIGLVKQKLGLRSTIKYTEWSLALGDKWVYFTWTDKQNTKKQFLGVLKLRKNYSYLN